MNESDMVVLDTETTGLDPATEEIFEISVLDLGTRQHKTWRIQPKDDTVANMHPRAAEVNRYHERTSDNDWVWDLKLHNGERDFVEARSVLEDITNWLDRKHVLGAVPDFDARFLTSLYKSVGEAPPRWHYHLLDIEVLAAGWLLKEQADHIKMTGQPSTELQELLSLPYKSDDLAAYMGVEPPTDEERHTALGDVLWVARWWDALKGTK